MSITKCMIAGLPGSGKSTYIGALWYCLMHPEKIEGIKFVADKMNLADDLTVLNRLSDAYKSMKRKENLIPLGGLLLTTGLVTGINTFFVKDKKGKNALLLSGGIQIGAGITFLIASTSRKYHFQGDHKICTFQ